MRWGIAIQPVLKILSRYRPRYFAGIFLLVAMDLLQVVLGAYWRLLRQTAGQNDSSGRTASMQE